jgi:hypothetical protein
MRSTWKIINESNRKIIRDKGKYSMVLDIKAITNKKQFAEAFNNTFYL